jgi:ABC-2 type transport system permease protein
MNKLWLIIKREYLTRVRKRTFILATILTPLAFALFFVVVTFIFSYESDDSRRVAIIDESNMLHETIKDEQNLYFKFEPEKTLEQLKEGYIRMGYDGILVIPEIEDIKSNWHQIFFYSDEQLGLDVRLVIEQKVKDAIREYKIETLQLDKNALKSLATRVTLDPEPINNTSVNDSSMTGFIAAGIGGFMGIIMYMTVFIYGMMVMRSVMEEKTTRIVEVMISSVKPFQLMMGKIIGVGAVGLTQVAIWAILIPSIFLIVSLVFGIDSAQMQEVSNAGPGPQMDMEDMEYQVAEAINELNNLNWWMIIPLFIFYFLGGYFLYASLFAAVGSAMGDDMGEGQALTIPITIPVVLAFYIMFVAIQAPNSSLAVWSSVFPLFSPIVMPARLAFSPPLWEIAFSMVILAFTAIFFVWLSGRIYRVGILMYGKKVSFKELAKWMFYKD